MPSSRSDAEIGREVRTDLALNVRPSAGQLAVEVRDGTVYLRGVARSLEEKQLAEEISWWTAGVRDVVNELRVASVA
jgi:osmotically-inducible protein OsmY